MHISNKQKLWEKKILIPLQPLKKKIMSLSLAKKKIKKLKIKRQKQPTESVSWFEI